MRLSSVIHLPLYYNYGPRTHEVEVEFIVFAAFCLLLLLAPQRNIAQSLRFYDKFGLLRALQGPRALLNGTEEL